MQDHLTNWIAFHRDVRRASANTLKSYETSARQYRTYLRARHLTVLTATFGDLCAYATHLQTLGLSAATIRVKLAAVRSLHKYLHASGARTENPAELVSAPKPRDSERTRHYIRHPPADCETVRANLKTPAERAAFALMYDLALRCASAASILRENIDPATWTVSVIQKGGSLHSVPVYNVTARTALWEQLEATGRHRAYLLPGTASGSHRSTGTLNRWIHEAASRAGLNPAEWSPHALRHSMAETLRQSGALDAFQLQNYLGHKNLETTGIYTAANLPAAIAEHLTRQTAGRHA